MGRNATVDGTSVHPQSSASPTLRARFAPTSWREWLSASRLAADKLGVTMTELGEMLLTAVIQALHVKDPTDLVECTGVTCAGCSGLAIEVDEQGLCRRCAQGV
jgi:hypothetical protein